MTKKSIKKKVATKKVETKKSSPVPPKTLQKEGTKDALKSWADLAKKEQQREETQNKLRLEDAIEPLGPRLLVIRDTPEAITEKGIIIPTLAQDRPNVGTVVKAGEGCMNTWATGDRVLITETVGREITVAKWTVVLLDEDDILMRFSKKSGI
tara:strand:+ start:1008 stop:1466 length:459 start_codon:yes stop_codon:yes gene_type:complete